MSNLRNECSHNHFTYRQGHYSVTSLLELELAQWLIQNSVPIIKDNKTKNMAGGEDKPPSPNISTLINPNLIQLFISVPFRFDFSLISVRFNSSSIPVQSQFKFSSILVPFQFWSKHLHYVNSVYSSSKSEVTLLWENIHLLYCNNKSGNTLLHKSRHRTLSQLMTLVMNHFWSLMTSEKKGWEIEKVQHHQIT